MSPAATASPEHSSLERQLARGVAWTAAAKWITQIFTWMFTLISVRLLAPADFGVSGMGTLYMGIAAIVAEFGIGSAIVATGTITRDQTRQMNTIAVLFGVAGCITSIGLAAPVADFFAVPQLSAVVSVLSIVFVTSGLRTVPAAMLQKD